MNTIFWEVPAQVTAPPNPNPIELVQQGFTYIFEHWDRIELFFWEHLKITGVSLAIALVIALPLGVLISRVHWLSAPVLSVLGILYTVPSLAFLAILVPVYGLGFTTVVIVLVAYAQTMLVRNVALAFNGIDPSIIEAARGMGMSGWQTFYKVELPLAVPIILAGMRIATLAIVSIATIGAWVGADSLGKLIKPTNSSTRIMAGILLIIFIAVVADQLYRLVERLAGGYLRKQPALERQVRRIEREPSSVVVQR